MATFPTSHASSPAVVKTAASSNTITTASFTPPDNCTIVVGFTSDASSGTTEGAPTISNTGTAVTWTLERSRRFGSPAGADQGIVALWSAKITTSPGAITVTCNNGRALAENVPRMLVVRVYDSTQVDLADPIGAIVEGSFAASSTSISGSVTPETTNGGLRGLWLDWNATGTPTAFLPNNTDTELVDGYHNAGLSTNVQLGKSTTTVAGVAQTIGANLLSAASDGNFLFYELRAGSPLTGPAFDAGAFDDTAFYTADATGITGSLSASVPRVTAASSGTVVGPQYTATLAATTPLTTGAATGTAAGPPYAGSLSASTPKTTGTLAGSVVTPSATGTLSASTIATTGSISGTAAGPVYVGTLAATTPATTGATSGTVTGPGTTGTLTATTPLTTGSTAGTVVAPTYTGTLNATTPKVAGATTGTAPAPTYAATINAPTPPTRSTISGTATNPAGSGTLSAATPKVTGSVSGTVSGPAYTGVTLGQLARLTAAATGVVAGPQYVGAVASVLAGPRGSIAGTTAGPTIMGSLAAALPVVTASLLEPVDPSTPVLPPGVRDVPRPFAVGAVDPTHQVAPVASRFDVAPVPENNVARSTP